MRYFEKLKDHMLTLTIHLCMPVPIAMNMPLITLTVVTLAVGPLHNTSGPNTNTGVASITITQNSWYHYAQ